MLTRGVYDRGTRAQFCGYLTRLATRKASDAINTSTFTSTKTKLTPTCHAILTPIIPAQLEIHLPSASRLARQFRASFERQFERQFER